MQLPPSLPDPEPVPFPLAVVLVPVLTGAVLFALTRSPLTLALAALGPVAGIAGVLDGLRRRRKTRSRAVARRRQALSALREELEEEHQRRRAELLAASPPAADVLAGRAPGDRLVLGFGPVPSGIRLRPAEPEDEGITRDAAVLADCPITVPRTGPVGVAGPAPLTSAVRRAIEAQGRHPPVDEARAIEDLPPRCSVVLRLDGVGRAVLLTPDEAGGHLRPELVSRPAVAAADSRGPASLGELGLPAAGGSGLPARFATGPDGPLELDLVRDGPHAVVGGTTGSGKSELLVAWMTALARAHPPERLALLLVDFKGGTAFDPLAVLPHTAGVVTDLDPAALARLATGLRSELVRREQVLRDAGARSVEAAPGLPRLVVVVDEFAALLAAHPALAEVFTDAASRGRALGVHLVLCTQRPAGAMRDALLANCGLRIGLRMLATEDSRVLLGTADAALLPSGAPGRCVVSRQGEPPLPCRVVPASPGDLAGIRRGRRVEPVWLPPLPPLVRLADLPRRSPDELVLGLADQPERRRQAPAVWRPGEEGPLLVAGERGSGRSTLLAALAAQGDSVLVRGGADDGAEALWDSVISPPPGLLLVDDLDLALGGLGDEHRIELTERLAHALRSGRVRAAAAVQAPLAGWARPLASSFARTLGLRMPRDDHALLLGGPVPPAEAAPPPGAGWWRGDRVQVAWAPASPAAAVRPAVERIALREPLVVVSRMPGLPAADGITAVTPEDWRSRPELWPLAARVPLLLVGCAAADHRAITGRRELPPPLAPLPGRAWLVRPGTAAVRAVLRLDG
ncbi:FtsK/SpoIIIE domain-containing protein [Naasia sp. SYSU D00948]|uniref:FtsK/SpoIIIE domain-containing protein n=1 Tax=Naasia sp. SYSU D00948 TaxID=2817379 RepID=UPI001B3047A9|nr:FtsK/SpoIIIE domain-containing protein [Naasia sp. SYSU D00948]